MKNTFVLSLVAFFLFAASLTYATITVYPIEEKSTSYSFSLKGETGETNVENIDKNGEFYIHLCNNYDVIVKGYELTPDKKGKKFVGGISSETFTYSPKKKSFKYKANSVNSSFELGSFDSEGKPTYTSVFKTKGKASAKGVLANDISEDLKNGKIFGLCCSTNYPPDMLVRGTAKGKAGKSWKCSEKLPDGSKMKFSLKNKKKAVSMSFKTSTFVHPCFTTEP
ncbi:hypothetical protein IKZ80_03980 [bacterium]|nr:hypothetical protein [bacterium]MBR6462742.1 hypothetical protein [bacterium]